MEVVAVGEAVVAMADFLVVAVAMVVAAMVVAMEAAGRAVGWAVAEKVAVMVAAAMVAVRAVRATLLLCSTSKRAQHNSVDSGAESLAAAHLLVSQYFGNSCGVPSQ